MAEAKTKVQAIVALIKKNGGTASWDDIYKNIEKFYPTAKASQFWQEGIRGVVYREIRYGRTFKMVETGVVGLTDLEPEEGGCIYEHDHSQNDGRDCEFHD
jgi:hypothetical protein